jgi:glutathione peroxidase
MLKTIMIGAIAAAISAASAAAQVKNLYSFKMKDINGKEVDFAQYKGKKVLIVNVASQCGYTRQYKDLQELHTKYGDKVVVLGFPANNFGGQEPGTNKEIAAFCEKNYGVKFTIFEKISVKGPDAHPLYKWLSSKAENGVIDEAPSWNFCKYLIDENGIPMKFFKSGTNPMSNDIISLL